MSQFFLTGVTGYVLYKYVYLPWKIMRADIAALADAMQKNHEWVKLEMGLRLQTGMSHEEQAIIERRMLARQRNGLGNA